METLMPLRWKVPQHALIRKRVRAVDRCTKEHIMHSCPSSSHGPKGTAWEMYTRLPRELRNHIYTFYLHSPYDNDVIVRRSSYRLLSKPSFKLLIRQHSGLHSYQWLEDPIFSTINSQTLGHAVSRELLETYYWTRTFRFSHMDLALLQSFLNTDTHGWNVLPVHYARRIQLQIQPFACAKIHHSGTPRWVEDEAWRCAGEALAQIPERRMEVEVVVDLARGSMLDGQYERCADEVEGLLVEVVRVVKKEKERGVKIKVVFSETWDEK